MSQLLHEDHFASQRLHQRDVKPDDESSPLAQTTITLSITPAILENAGNA